MLSELFPAIRATLVLATFTGLIFPLAITGIAQVAFNHQANGSLLWQNSHSVNTSDATGDSAVHRTAVLIGSDLLGQSFSKPEYFHSRPSSAGSGYAGEASGGSNLGPTSKKLMYGDESFKGIDDLVKEYRVQNGLAPNFKVPVDAVTRSASGLDPHISPVNALLQVDRVATARNLPVERLRQIVLSHVEDRSLGIIGEPRVNVLRVNNFLDLNYPH